MPGNHDFRLIAPWLELARAQRPRAARAAGARRPRRRRSARAPSAADAAARPRSTSSTRACGSTTASTPPTATTSIATSPSRASSAWASGVLGRLLRAPADGAASPDDYEVALAPMYELLDAIAARVGDGRAAAPGQASRRAPGERLSPDGARDALARPRARRRLPARHRGAQPARASGRCKADLSGRRAAPREPARHGRGRGAPGHRRAPRDLRPHPPLGPAARRRRRRVAAGRRGAARQHGLLGLRVDVPRPRLGQPVLARAARSSSRAAASRASARLLEGVDAGALRPPAAPLPA